MIINTLILIFGIACIAYFLALGFTVRFGQSLMFLWPVVGGLCILRFIMWTIFYTTDRYPPRGLTTALRCIILLGVVFFLAVEGVIFMGGNIKPEAGLERIIVLGAKVNGTQPSGALRNRIQRASEYLNENPDAIAILSGGKGDDEGISEAQCMFNGMTERGIPEERLIMEDRSTNTSENLQYSRAIINDDSIRTGIVTNNFHMFRALALARKQGMNVSGIPVETSLISYPHYMMREFVGVVYDGLHGNLAFR